MNQPTGSGSDRRDVSGRVQGGGDDPEASHDEVAVEGSLPVERITRFDAGARENLKGARERVLMDRGRAIDPVKRIYVKSWAVEQRERGLTELRLEIPLPRQRGGCQTPIDQLIRAQLPGQLRLRQRVTGHFGELPLIVVRRPPALVQPRAQLVNDLQAHRRARIYHADQEVSDRGLTAETRISCRKLC